MRFSPNHSIARLHDREIPKMVISHFIAMLLFAFFVSVVFGVLTKETPRDCVIYSAKTFGAFVGIALVMGWVMFAFAR